MPPTASLLPPLLLAIFTTAAFGGDGKCAGALECNARLCYDCACVSGKCRCGSGYSGDNCQTPFCQNRTQGCSGHGECIQSLQNITCDCDKGFVGSRCQVKTCTLECKHGGTPYNDCTRCDGCKGAWGGKLCDKWNGGVPAGQLMAKLEQIANASQKMLDAQKQFNPICKQGHECVGWGVDGFTGRPTAFPIVHLSYDPSRVDKRFNGMNEPVEVVANHIVKPVWASTDGANTFPRISDLVQHINTNYAGATPVPKGTNGIYSQNVKGTFENFFQKDDDRALSVVRASKSVISMSLPVDPGTRTRKYRIDRHALDFVQSLPPLYDTDENKAQFRYFIEKYGTSFATSASLGGLVEQYSSWKTWLTEEGLGGFTMHKLERNAEIDFSTRTGLPGASGAHDKGYGAGTVNVQPLFCMGGDSSVNCDADFQSWANSIEKAPVLLDYTLAPISDLVSDPDVKAALDAAVREYIKEKQTEWEDQNKCPVNCGLPGAGTCKAGQEEQCTCSFPGMVGRQCTGCAPVDVRGTFTDIHGKEYSGVISVPCDGKGHVAWSGSGACQTADLGAYLRQSAKCSSTSQVVCTRSTGDGNLIATVNQPPCYVTGMKRCSGRGCPSPPPSPKGFPKYTVQCGGMSAGSNGNPNPGKVSGASASCTANSPSGGRFKSYPPACFLNTRKAKDPCTVKAKCEFV